MRTFLLSSFPTLSPEGASPMRFRDFLRECANHLPEAEMEELDAVCGHSPAGKSTLGKDWSTVIAQCQSRNEQERRERLSLENPARQSAEVTDDQLRGDLEEAWQSTDPLSRELQLQRALWNWIEARRRKNPFSREDLLGYALQLQLLERRELWKESEGQKQFQEHTQSFLEPVLEEVRKQELSV